MISKYLEKIASDAFDDEIQKHAEGTVVINNEKRRSGIGGALFGTGLGVGGGYALAKSKLGNKITDAGGYLLSKSGIKDKILNFAQRVARKIK